MNKPRARRTHLTVIDPVGFEYPSIAECAQSYGLLPDTIRRRCERETAGWRFGNKPTDAAAKRARAKVKPDDIEWPEVTGRLEERLAELGIRYDI